MSDAAIDTLVATFAAGAVVTRVSASEVERWTPDAFVAPRVTLLTGGALTGFHEREVAAKTDPFGAIAQRGSRYRKAGRAVQAR